MFQTAMQRMGLASINSGVLALVTTLLIWSSYFVALRSGAQSSLTSFDMALLRFLLPALVLLPVLYRSRRNIFKAKKRYLIGISVGAGLPFYLLSVIASGHVKAVVGSLLVPGVAPVFVTLMAILFYKEKLSKRRLVGLSIVLVGISILVSANLDSGAENSYLGAVFYMLAASCWAVYTVSIKVAKLSGLELAAVLNIVAAIGLLLSLPFGFFETNLAATPWAQIVPQLIIMGIFCGLISVVTYGHAINELGAELSVCWGALTPVLVSVLAFIILKETVEIETVIAMLIITTGVVCANFKFRKKSNKKLQVGSTEELGNRRESLK